MPIVKEAFIYGLLSIKNDVVTL